MIKLDDGLLERAQIYSDENGIPLKDFIEDAIDISMTPEQPLPNPPVKVVIQKVYVEKKTKHVKLKPKKQRFELKRYGCIDPTDFGDRLYEYALNIHDSLQTAGAVAGVDYTFIDLYKLAEPYLLQEIADKEQDIYFHH